MEERQIHSAQRRSKLEQQNDPQNSTNIDKLSNPISLNQGYLTQRSETHFEEAKPWNKTLVSMCI